MERVQKARSLQGRKADAEKDIELINQFSLRELKPDEVFCFSVHLCDNEVDRDNEQFPEETLQKMAELFVGKTGVMDHAWSAKNQVARLYRTEVVKDAGKNAIGEDLYYLRGDAYMLRNDATKNLIDAIEAGIVKEVSIGCSIAKRVCSICGEPFYYDWRDGGFECENRHMMGNEYDGKMCVGKLLEPKDAYEFSFVPVPAQRSAGVIKSNTDIRQAFQTLLDADINDSGDMAQKLMPKIIKALEKESDRKKRAEILLENKKYLKKG